MNYSILYGIFYTDIRTGERKCYMNVGFETYKLASDERDRILKMKKKYKDKITTEYLNQTTHHVLSCFVGKNWRIKPIKIRNNE